MPDIRLQTDMPDKASEILFEALDLQKSRLQYSLNLARKRLEKFENKYGVTSRQFMDNWSAEDLEGQDFEYIEWAGEYKLAASILYKIDIITGIRHDAS